MSATGRFAAILSLLLAGAPAVRAQTVDPHAAQPERPSVATHAQTIAPGWVELEAGGEWSRPDGRFSGAGLPLTVKIGLAPRAQLSLSTAVVRPAGGPAAPGDLGVGVKWRLADHIPGLGALAILPGVRLPIDAAGAASSGEAAAGILVISSHALGPLALDLNAGYTRAAGDGSRVPRSEALWAAALAGPLGGRVGWVAELYGRPTTRGPAGEPATVATLLGPSLALAPWLTLDLALVVPVRGPEAHAVYAGAVWNLGRLAP